MQGEKAIRNISHPAANEKDDIVTKDVLTATAKHFMILMSDTIIKQYSQKEKYFSQCSKRIRWYCYQNKYVLNAKA